MVDQRLKVMALVLTKTKYFIPLNGVCQLGKSMEKRAFFLRGFVNGVIPGGVIFITSWLSAESLVRFQSSLQIYSKSFDNISYQGFIILGRY